MLGTYMTTKSDLICLNVMKTELIATYGLLNLNNQKNKQQR